MCLQNKTETEWDDENLMLVKNLQFIENVYVHVIFLRA
jgi:hypothetical protein